MVFRAFDRLGKGKPEDLPDKMTVREALEFMHRIRGELDAM